MYRLGPGTKMRGTQLVESQTGLFGIGIMRTSEAIGVPIPLD